MSIPEQHFKDAEGVIEWHKTRVPDSYERYLEIKKRIKDSAFSGSAKLLRNVDGDKSVTGFLSYLAEMNLANVLLTKSVHELLYEPKDTLGTDFTFDDIALSVKNLHPKNYEKDEQLRIDEMRAEGGGSTTFTHKNFSSIFLQVKKTAMGTFGWERTETGHSGFLDSDLYEMSAPLRYIGEFEDINVGDRKKILFFFIQSAEFANYYIADIVAWYFGARDYKHPIFQNNMAWYYKLLKKPTKNDSVDGLVFMYAPDSVLSWPHDCMSDIRDGKARVVICTREKTLWEKLKTIFS